MPIERRRRANGMLPGALLALSIVACDSGGTTSDDAVVRDSAGIRIVESSVPRLAPDVRWSIAREPVFEIGANESDSMQTLHQVEGAVRLTDGRVVVANGAAPVLRWYDVQGAFVTGAGRYGQGPGEFDSGEGSAWIYALWPFPGDSVATWEHSRRRMQVFDPQGRYARSVVIDLPPNMPEMAYPQIAGRTGAGFVAFLLDARAPDGPLGVVRRDSATFIRYAIDGKFVRTLARLPGFVRYMGEFRRPGRPPLRGPMAQPFAPSFVAWPHRDRFYYGNTERYEIVAYDTSGAVRTLIRRAGARRPVTPQIIEEFRSTSIASAGDNPDRRRQVEERLAAAPFPDSLPAYRSFRFDREGLLWVQEYRPPGATSVTWSVFDQEGRWLTEIAVPGSWDILEIGRDYVLTLESDELDVERVRMYALTRGPA